MTHFARSMLTLLSMVFLAFAPLFCAVHSHAEMVPPGKVQKVQVVTNCGALGAYIAGQINEIRAGHRTEAEAFALLEQLKGPDEKVLHPVRRLHIERRIHLGVEHPDWSLEDIYIGYATGCTNAGGYMPENDEFPPVYVDAPAEPLKPCPDDDRDCKQT